MIDNRKKNTAQEFRKKKKCKKIVELLIKFLITGNEICLNILDNEE